MTSVPQPANPTVAYTCTYDAWNRLVQVVDAPSGDTVAQYAYDGAKRRTIKLTYAAGVLSETRHFFYTDPTRWQVVEERTGTSTTAERQFVLGLRYIDDLVLRDRDTSGSGTLNERLYGLQDPNWNMVAIVDSTGVVQERYSYDAYGTVTFLTPAFAIRFASVFAWETLYAGYRRDGETGLSDVRNRVLDAPLGWLQRDPLGLVSGINPYQYCVAHPVGYSDPTGTVVQFVLGGCLGGAALSLFLQWVFASPLPGGWPPPPGLDLTTLCNALTGCITMACRVGGFFVGAAVGAVTPPPVGLVVIGYFWGIVCPFMGQAFCNWCIRVARVRRCASPNPAWPWWKKVIFRGVVGGFGVC